MATVTSLYAIVFVTPIFMSMDVLPAYMYVTHMHTVPSFRGHMGDRVTFFLPVEFFQRV